MSASRVTILAPLTIVVGVMSCSLALAQDKYPSRPVRIILSLPAGSSPDVRVRVVADQLTKRWGQQVVVENRPGGGGLIGAQAVLAAVPDGYTLLAAPGSTFQILPAQKDKLPIDVNRDLVPIGLTAIEGLMLAVSPKLGVNSLAELITLAKKAPHTIVIGTNPAGTLPHLAARLLVERSKAPFTVLPYSTGGTNEAIRDILGGRVHAVIEFLGWSQGYSRLRRPKGPRDHVQRTTPKVPGPPRCGGNNSGSHGGRLASPPRPQGHARRDH